MPRTNYVIEVVDVYSTTSPRYKILEEAGIDPDEDWRVLRSVYSVREAERIVNEEARYWGPIRRYRWRTSEE